MAKAPKVEQTVQETPDPVVSRADEAAAISETKERKGALSTFLSRGSGIKQDGLGGFFKKLLGE